MKKCILILISICLLTMLFSSCGNPNNEEIESKNNEQIQQMLEVYNVNEVYIVKISIAQKHQWWEFEQNIKDSMNNSEIVLPVMKEYYESIAIGDSLEDSFRWGSFWMSGTFGSWDIKIVDKQIISKE